MVQEEMPQAWWFDSHNLARPSPWLNSTLSGFASLSPESGCSAVLTACLLPRGSVFVLQTGKHAELSLFCMHSFILLACIFFAWICASTNIYLLCLCHDEVPEVFVRLLQFHFEFTWEFL
jgi:hypothetical protein